MAHIKVEEGVPGIRGLAMFRPETGKPLYKLAQALLRGESPLTEAERELIAAYVSHRNNCTFCMKSHAAVARHLYNEDKDLVDEVLANMRLSGVSDKMKALLNIAGQVQISGRNVRPVDVSVARALGADDRSVHDTVLIAATFSMFNRYVDGLDSFTPDGAEVYEEMGERLATKGYVLPARSNKTTP